MKSFITSRVFVLLILFFLASVSNAQPFSAGTKKILFLGNSITYAGQYITDIEAYCAINYPDRKMEFINMGLPSETVAGLSEPGHAGGKFPRPDLHERLDRVLEVTKPDLVFACYGMNDGLYMPFDQERFEKFKAGINWLHDKVAGTGVRIIHVTPPIYDELRGGKQGYAVVLDRYADWLLGQKKTAGWEVADIHYPMKKYLEAHRKIDAAFNINGFYLAADGVHPAEVGHWIMAKELLLYMGEKQVVSGTDVLAVIKHSKKEELFKLVALKQSMMKDAWLTAAGHKRPMKAGLPLEEAKKKAAEIDEQISSLIK
ncbi:MAG: SGNH/GDSL hydrolase family protein [Candidatus Pedobacter colombiensis]|uniref:SGNH/GDSL hydrolase family protein n=1 Tax=Candidatus Pedobacter colombiensis TaxID=3121371 RepID=A0AAJ5W5P5_9SPHI|nr:SGNH/GDSL hydrolase family protein [Pedobacter sp.]WEK18050.1 MAG: SGNH/GDSL hydrolase family protein [Pedobacter sp.]